MVPGLSIFPQWACRAGGVSCTIVPLLSLPGASPAVSADEERGMAGKSIDAKTQVMRMASLSVSWGILAGIAYLGLIKVAVDYATSQTPWPGFAVDSGIIAINPAHVASTYQGLTSAAL